LETYLETRERPEAVIANLLAEAQVLELRVRLGGRGLEAAPSSPSSADGGDRHPTHKSHIVSLDHRWRDGRRRRLEPSLGNEINEALDALVRRRLRAHDLPHSIDNPLVPATVEPLNQVSLAINAEV
jgi:hypothetical protein